MKSTWKHFLSELHVGKKNHNQSRYHSRILKNLNIIIPAWFSLITFRDLAGNTIIAIKMDKAFVS